MTRVSDEPCVVLHTRPYRESSLIVSVLSMHHGRLGLVAKGLRGSRRGRVLQPLNVLRAGWFGRSSLMTLTSFEAERQPWLQGDALAAGFYVLELVSRLVGERESHPRLFSATVWVIDQLSDDMEPALRIFEKLLLEELGYGVDFERDARQQQPISAEKFYRFDPAEGFVITSAERGYPGTSLRAIAAGDYSGQRERRIARRVMREALAPHLGTRPLLSRRLLFSRGRT